jgi:hypothetical protein
MMWRHVSGPGADRAAIGGLSPAAVAAAYGLALVHERIRLHGETTYRGPVKFHK